ncbi:MAG: hypothetical protein CVV14_04085 [Gammaproteobacteria bacterium HGW-Gammaproteobacteria-4]|nr:MAG: hypothetical protein CVV14_04085 [Gammaproteobacteria bacterium HGW-Gammaproteobacteria-4]
MSDHDRIRPVANDEGGMSEPCDRRAGARARPIIGVGTHYLRYSSANLMVLLAGFVSFPLLTRLLDNTQYGILGYFETWVMLAVAIAKLGAQHSIIRFYPPESDDHRLGHFATNLVLLPILASLAIWAAIAIAIGIFDAFSDDTFSAVFWLALFLIPLVVIGSLVEMVFRASERSLLLTGTRVAKRWLELVLILSVVIAFQRSAQAVYIGKVAAAALVAVFYVRWMIRNLKFSSSLMDVSAIRASLVYGLPLVANEVAAVTLGSIDRVMLKHMTGDFAAVGIYTIGYSLAINVSLFMSATLNEAFVPVANRLFGTDGERAVRELKGRILLPMTYASVGVAVMLWCVGADALVALSGPSKAASGVVFATVGTLFALYPLIDIGGYGLLLKKRSLTVLSITLGAAIVNIALNLWLIPIMGVMGAVWATVISTIALGGAHWALCPRGLLRAPDTRALLLACLCALPLLAIIKGMNLFGLESVWLRLIVSGALFFSLYALPVWLFDPRLSAALREWRLQRSS